MLALPVTKTQFGRQQRTAEIDPQANPPAGQSLRQPPQTHRTGCPQSTSKAEYWRFSLLPSRCSSSFSAQAPSPTDAKQRCFPWPDLRDDTPSTHHLIPRYCQQLTVLHACNPLPPQHAHPADVGTPTPSCLRLLKFRQTWRRECFFPFPRTPPASCSRSSAQSRN
jgi:hypothetical protein